MSYTGGCEVVCGAHPSRRRVVSPARGDVSGEDEEEKRQAYEEIEVSF